jgi:phosphomevalonate kinase
MIAHAPGKVVITGAYAVLEGAPALVAAVDRYAVADTGRSADLVTPEVAAALRPAEPAPWFDAGELRCADRKLGLGSSAAILVASLAALEGSGVGDDALVSRVFGRALDAHRRAQKGGSGVDVAASCHGGVIRCVLHADRLEVTQTALPQATAIEVWASPQEASTPTLLAAFHALRDRNRRVYDRCVLELDTASRAALDANNAHAFTSACRAMLEGLERLGRESGASIVTSDMRAFDAVARRRGAVVVPSGAGGGDAILYIGSGPSDDESRRAALAAGLVPLGLTLGARGVHRATQEL